MTPAPSRGGGSAGEQAHTRSLFGGGTWSAQERKLLKAVIQEGPFLAPIFFDENAPCTAIDRDHFANSVAGILRSLKGCHQADDHTTALSQIGGSTGERAHNTPSLFGGGTWSDQERKLLKAVLKEGPFLAPIFFDENAPCTVIDSQRFITLVTDVVWSLNSCRHEENKTKAAVEKSLFEDIAVILKGKHEWLPAVLQAYLEQCPVTSDMVQETQKDTRISVMEHFKHAVLRIKNRMDGNGESLRSLAKQQLPPHIPIIPRPKREWQMVQPEEAVANKSARETNSDGDANAVYLNRDLSDHN
jgi:hypothetical protein